MQILVTGFLAILFASSFVYANVDTYKDAGKLLGDAEFGRALNLAGKQANDSAVVSYLKSRDCHKERPYSIDGMNAEFRRRLAKMMQEADSYGKKLYIMSGKRSESDQARLRAAGVKKYGANVGKWVGSVRGSKHVKGIAADLKIGSCKGQNPKKGGLVHKLANKHKLTFRLPHEPWHVEPVEGERIQSDLTKPIVPGAMSGGSYYGRGMVAGPKAVYGLSSDRIQPDPLFIFYQPPLYDDGAYYNKQTKRRYSSFVPISSVIYYR